MPVSILTPDPADAVNAAAERAGWPLRCTSLLEFERPELNLLRDIWRAKAEGDAVPFRAAFDARDLKPVLRCLSILQRVNDSGRPRYRMRLMGSDIVARFGEGTGRFLDQDIPPEILPRWTLAYDTVLQSARPLRFLSRFAVPKVSYLAGESFVAPLRDAAGAVTMVLTGLYFRSKVSDEALD